ALKAGQWSFEGKWAGYRLLGEVDHGALRIRPRHGREVTKKYPQFRLHGAENAGPRSPVEYWAFDLLYLDGRSLLRARYQDRRKLLEILAGGGNLIVPELLPGDGAQALDHSRKHGWEGVVAKKRDSTYQPGRRSASWIKDKNWKTQEVVIGGWKAGEGGRTSGIGSLLMGIPTPGGRLH